MTIMNGFADAIGNTPLIKLRQVSERTGCTILGKAEFMNPGGSVKDRAALYIVRDALERGALRPGGRIVEGTAGNTGIGLALVGNSIGCKSTIVIPETQSEEKKQTLRMLGADLVQVPAVPYKDPNNYVRVSERLANELAESEPGGAVWANQFDNVANRRAHFETTGPEIWEQTGGRIDAFVCGIGTGGTISGVGRYLKERDPSIRVIGVDPEGSVFHDQFHHGRLSTPHVYQVEGIGEDYLVEAVDFSVIDDIIRVDDRSSFLTARRLVREEGLLCGGSSGAAMWGALQVADRFPGGRIVVLLPDSGNMYLSKFLDDAWMVRHGHLAAPTAATPQAMAAVAGAE